MGESISRNLSHSGTAFLDSADRTWLSGHANKEEESVERESERGDHL